MPVVEILGLDLADDSADSLDSTVDPLPLAGRKPLRLPSSHYFLLVTEGEKLSLTISVL
jgi:hypothetical protein